MGLIYESKRYRALVRLAFAHLDLPTVKKSKHFTFVLKQGRLVVWGWNQRTQIKYLNGQNYTDFTKHSEVHALNRLLAQTRNGKLIGKQYTLVNVRLNRAGQLGFSKPCKACQEEIQRLGIREVVFSCDNESFARHGL